MSNCNRDPKELNAIYEHYKAHPLRIEISYEGVQKARPQVDLTQFEPISAMELIGGDTYVVTDGFYVVAAVYARGGKWFLSKNIAGNWRGYMNDLHITPTHARPVREHNK